MYTKTELKTGIFFNLGTALTIPKFLKLNENLQRIWADKYHPRYKENTDNRSCLSAEETYEKFGQYHAEFATITSAEFGLIEELKPKAPLTISVDKITGTEKNILDTLHTVFDKATGCILAGWNIANYQIPFIIKKMMINGVKIPFLLQLRNKKPWDISMLDIMRDYQGNMFGEIPVELVANQFSVPYAEDKQLQAIMEIAIKMSI